MKRRGYQFGGLELTAFITGFALMAYELAAARILAPSIGSSTYIWTSIIGIIIAALSLGYFIGGKVADTRNKVSDIPLLCLAAALAVVVTLLACRPFLDWVVGMAADPRLQGTLAAIVLFAPASFLLGMISPYLVKMNITSLGTSGQSVASLSALNSVGGIAGTFVTGFVLFGYVGAAETLKIVAVLLLVVSWLLVPKRLFIFRVLVTMGLVVCMFIPAAQSPSVVRVDTPSAHYEIVTGQYRGETITGLITGPGGIQSAVIKDNPKALAFWYNREIARVILDKRPQRVLVLGGGAFTLPQYLADKLPDSQIDVVEIDPELETISEKYFGFTHPDNVQLIFEDARTFVNRAHEPYDVVVVDVYGNMTIPFSLTTKEYGKGLARQVKPDGVVLANLIAGNEGGACERVFGVIDAAYRQELPYALYATERGVAAARANFVVAYSRQPQPTEGMRTLTPLGVTPLTDNYAPTERLFFECTQTA